MPLRCQTDAVAALAQALFCVLLAVAYGRHRASRPRDYADCDDVMMGAGRGGAIPPALAAVAGEAALRLTGRMRERTKSLPSATYGSTTVADGGEAPPPARRRSATVPAEGVLIPASPAIYTATRKSELG
jgi:hypothetical protein